MAMGITDRVRTMGELLAGQKNGPLPNKVAAPNKV
jgi:hypothetical protein